MSVGPPNENNERHGAKNMSYGLAIAQRIVLDSCLTSILLKSRI